MLFQHKHKSKNLSFANKWNPQQFMLYADFQLQYTERRSTIITVDSAMFALHALQHESNT